MSRDIPSYETIKNETLYDIDNQPGFIDYEVETPFLKCCSCGRRRIKDTATKCPECKSYDLVPDKTEKSTHSVYR